MRLLIVGTLNGQLTTATKLAMDKGALVTHAAISPRRSPCCAPVAARTF